MNHISTDLITPFIEKATSFPYAYISVLIVFIILVAIVCVGTFILNAIGKWINMVALKRQGINYGSILLKFYCAECNKNMFECKCKDGFIVKKGDKRYITEDLDMLCVRCGENVLQCRCTSEQVTLSDSPRSAYLDGEAMLSGQFYVLEKKLIQNLDEFKQAMLCKKCHQSLEKCACDYTVIEVKTISQLKETFNVAV